MNGTPFQLELPCVQHPAGLHVQLLLFGGLPGLPPGVQPLTTGGGVTSARTGTAPTATANAANAKLANNHSVVFMWIPWLENSPEPGAIRYDTVSETRTSEQHKPVSERQAFRRSVLSIAPAACRR